MRRFLLLSTLACFAGTLSAQTPCSNPFDGNGDGAVTITDLLDLLILFGDVDMDEDGIWDSLDDCVDIGACNYAASPTEPCLYIDALDVCGGACEGDDDEDGICDDVDTCVGDLDECGVCNGPGPTEIVIDEIVITYDSIYLPVDGEWFVYAVDVDTTFTYTCASSFASCGDPVSYQGYDYATVQIGDQCWFAENLRNENYANGDVIPAGLSDSSWVFTSFGALAVFGEGASACYHASPDGNACDELWSLNEFGRLYNWYSVVDSRGLCPDGWHAPSDSEWMMLEMALGMSEELVIQEGFRGSQGNDMKSDFGWSLNDGYNGSNTSGFSGFSGGLRAPSTGQFSNVGTEGYWWSTTANQSQAWIRGLETWSSRVIRDDLNPRLGLSVRCVQDEATCLLDEDEDGICDSLDDCIGEIDACGVCNGLGEIYDCGCTDIPAGQCDCEGNLDADEDGICDYLDDCVGDLDDQGVCNCGEHVYYQGHEYATVYIGGRCWFAENLRSENYTNGEPLPANLSSSEWTSTTSGAVAVYGEGDVSCSESSPSGDACDESWSLNAYGRLYNWYAVDDSRGLCPNDWKVPSDEDWMQLTSYLGGEATAGGSMKTDFGWASQPYNPFFSTNTSGFSGLPGGKRNGAGVNATFSLAGLGGHWWSSSAVGSNAWDRSMYYGTGEVYRYERDKHDGYSIRCVKNAD